MSCIVVVGNCTDFNEAKELYKCPMALEGPTQLLVAFSLQVMQLDEVLELELKLPCGLMQF